MKVICSIEIDLTNVQKDNKNQLINNDMIYKYISNNIDKSNKLNVTFKKVSNAEVGNRGFLSQILDEFNIKS